MATYYTVKDGAVVVITDNAKLAERVREESELTDGSDVKVWFTAGASREITDAIAAGMLEDLNLVAHTYQMPSGMFGLMVSRAEGRAT